MKSTVTEAKLTKRMNTGDYSFEEYTLTAQVDVKESGAEVLYELKKQIGEAFIGAMEVTTEEEPKTKKEKKGKKANGKGKSSTTDNEDESDSDSAEDSSEDEDESSSDNEATDDEDGDSSDDSSDESEEAEESEDDSEEEEVAAKPVKGAKADKGGKAGTTKVRKAKPQGYDREAESHKALFSSLLGSVAPDWRKSEESKARAKKTSVTMAGKEFLDADGEILESFTAEVKKLMAPARKSK